MNRVTDLVIGLEARQSDPSSALRCTCCGSSMHELIPEQENDLSWGEAHFLVEPEKAAGRCEPSVRFVMTWSTHARHGSIEHLVGE